MMQVMHNFNADDYKYTEMKIDVQSNETQTIAYIA